MLCGAKKTDSSGSAGGQEYVDNGHPESYGEENKEDLPF